MEKLSEDVLKGVAEIADYLGETERRTYYMLEKKQIPGFKIGVIWHGRKTEFDIRYSSTAR